ncbi:aminotransferase class IV [Leptolyngbya sp. FACHB-261]|uniref:aminotransferase class IV n=1 Tax=Leptolyngbya sp. FACHB-261 TaxID=2692806 RepID=UPI001684B66B|nr:aminotransferase class IV [Leptolyngbya sp. FACHB-261]MBD2102583.1 aminotransferase class IV [Leptolyngbya sp. FACHB-261]
MGLLVNQDGVISPTATVSVLDRGFLYGDSVYEVVRTLAGKPFGLQEHLDRLRQSAAYLYLDVPWSDDHIGTEVARTLEQAANPESYVRIVVTRGAEEEISLLPGAKLQPSLIIVVRPISPEAVLPAQGIHLRLVPRQRVDRLALNPAAKTGNYLNNILALLEAQQSGADDALLLNTRGELTEATTSNLWLVSQGVVRTPTVEAGILHGITRHFLLQVLREQGIPHEETELRPEDLWTAEEAFLSSSVRLLMPVAQIDDYPLPKCPGPLTRTLWEGLLTLMRNAVSER